ncbi:hypothetical protein [Shahe hepe-like virus 2]|uniref:hypothetical protein n=1 Tax=Shahe hepe-like virus 2 TaxID=1923416 RepID=UPI00090A5FED|nr:hypothetical protein [Shahe hepe-like virus 2]APG77719.1 hypothetical protein [Shahe hepe-like virus 2]
MNTKVILVFLALYANVAKCGYQTSRMGNWQFYPLYNVIKEFSDATSVDFELLRQLLLQLFTQLFALMKLYAEYAAYLFFMVANYFAEYFINTYNTFVDLWQYTFGTLVQIISNIASKFSDQMAQESEAQLKLMRGINTTVSEMIHKNFETSQKAFDEFNKTLAEQIDELKELQTKMLEIMEKFQPEVWLTQHLAVVSILGEFNYEGVGSCAFGVCTLGPGEIELEAKIIAEVGKKGPETINTN